MVSRVLNSIGKISANIDQSIAVSSMTQADRNDGIRAAIVEVKNGAVISADAVEAWIESWDTPDELPMPVANSR